jgi:glycosyltransferase involved in cell wall biosynthesis
MSTKKALVSLAIFTYNQEDYVEEAIQSAFDQDYENLEILISDDNSTDNTFAKAQAMAKAYTGPHTIRLNQNVPNLGIANHHNKVIGMAQSELVVLVAGDDISHPQRVREVAEAWQANDKPFMLVSKFECIDKDSKPLPLEPHIHFRFPPEKLHPSPENLWNFLSLKSGLKVYGSTESVSKKAWDYFGPIHKDLRAEDIVYFFRALLLNKFHFIDATHVAYRMAHKIEAVQAPDPIKEFGQKVKPEYARLVHLYKMLQPALRQCQKDLETHLSKSPQSKSTLSPVAQKLKTQLKIRQLWIDWYHLKPFQKIKALLTIGFSGNKKYIYWTYKNILSA